MCTKGGTACTQFLSWQPMMLSTCSLTDEKLIGTMWWPSSWVQLDTSRLPVEDKEGWRIGHFERKIPDGYIETLQTGKNMISDPNLHLFYSKIRLIVRGDLWDRDRIKAIWNLNMGKYRELITVYIETLWPWNILHHMHVFENDWPMDTHTVSTEQRLLCKNQDESGENIRLIPIPNTSRHKDFERKLCVVLLQIENKSLKRTGGN